MGSIEADLRLFKQLNDEYESKPLVAAPRSFDRASMNSQAERRADLLQRKFDMVGTRVLEIGCGRGDLGEVLAERFGCEYVGVDITAYDTWSDMKRSGVDLQVHDVTLLDNAHLGQFDRIVSFAVFEHIARPYAGLEALASLLAPSGRAYLSANLYRGPKASHRYREVFFPFPHLLFSDSVFEAFYAERAMNSKPAWVNKLTAAQYREKVRAEGLTIIEEWASRTELDRGFYQRFEDTLGRYPVEDLETDFIHLILQAPDLEPEPPSPDAPGPTVAADRRVVELERRLEMIENSTSWRLTAPLRLMGDRWPSLRRRVARGHRH